MMSTVEDGGSAAAAPAAKTPPPLEAPGFKPVEQADTGVSKKTIAVSPAAALAIKNHLHKRGTPDAAIRIGVRGGGCSGFSYAIEFDDNPPRTGDLVIEHEVDGAKVRVFCDKKSLLYLGGSVLDFEKTLMFQGFKFRNPHEVTRCGCGHSFTVA